MPAAFNTEKRRQIGALLLVKPLSLGELRSRVGGDKSALRRTLEGLQAHELVEFVSSEAGHTGPGKPAGLWSLSEKGRELAEVHATGEEAASEDAPTGLIRRGSIYVRIPVAAHGRRVQTLLAEGDLIAASASVAQLDGDGSHLLVLFDAAVGVQPAENLIDALEGIGIGCDTGTVRFVQTAQGIIDLLRTARSSREPIGGERETADDG
jgi:DNA-binding HxlR family transcriptional regulator